MGLYGLRLRDCGIGSLAAKLDLIFTFPQQAGCNKHSRVVDHLSLGRSTMEIVHPSPNKSPSREGNIGRNKIAGDALLVRGQPVQCTLTQSQTMMLGDSCQSLLSGRYTMWNLMVWVKE